MTSPAVQLAMECGAVENPWAFSGEIFKCTLVSKQLERFYARAQAQALLDAAHWFDMHWGTSNDWTAHEVDTELRRMAEELEASCK